MLANSGHNQRFALEYKILLKNTVTVRISEKEHFQEHTYICIIWSVFMADDEPVG